MQINCPKCQSQLDVPDDAAGKETTCPSCQETFVVQGQAAPAGAGQPAPAEPAEPGATPQAAPAGAGAKAKANELYGKATTMQVGGFSLLKIVAAAGGVLLLLSFFLPWWGMSLELTKVKDGDRDAAETAGKEFRKFGKVMRENDDFYEDVLGDDAEEDFEEDLKDVRKEIEDDGSGTVSMSAFGWNLARGIVTFIFAFLVLGLVAVVMFVPPVQKFAFALLLPAALLGLIVLILTLTVWFGTPGEDTGSKYVEFDQGVSFGTFVALFGSLGVLAGAGLEGVLGLLGFIKGAKS